jgi:hypothetical protein
MSAIRNVGELASPYYLLEVWARQEEIDIDPETYASLKRKARKLVRDARGFEMRGEDPDDEWRNLRSDMLALDSATDRTVTLDDGSEFKLGVWAEPSGAEALLVGDLPGWADPDRRSQEEDDPPATRFEFALDAYAGDADWGLLLAGLQVRVYRRSSGLSQQYLALDLDTLVELDDEPTWKAFAAMFRAPAFDAGSTGVPLIRRVVDESRRHASELAADMRKDIVDAAEAIIQGALHHPDNRELIGEPTRATLHQLFEESLYVLYRVLFVLYAEARGVLPVSGGGPYSTTYSLEHLVELARHGRSKPDGRYYHDVVQTLFGLLWVGPQEVTARLGFDPVGGELFDPERTPLLGSCVVPDPAWERAITSVALGAPGSPRRRLGRRSSFGELGVDQLGSIYEGLLVLEPYLAAETAYLGLHKGDRRVFPERDIEKFSVLRELQPGDFVLESAGGRRKGSGSFYTPHEITEYLTHAALDPLVDQVFGDHPDEPDFIAEQILSMKVCDPAMGSGAFLVQAARVLAVALARARAMKDDGLVTPDRVQHAKREVVRHCLYGVDLNPLAVVLAKVSLWLETLEPGRPLSFLDAHLRCGDSLVGVSFLAEGGSFSAAELATYSANAHSGLETYLKNEACERGEPVLARLKGRKKPAQVSQPQLPGFDRTSVEAALEELAAEREHIAELEERAETLFDVQDVRVAFDELEATDDSIRNRLRHAADFWCAQWFSEGEDAPCDDRGPVVPATFGQFDEVVSALVAGGPVSERLKPLIAAAERVAARRRFFHWVLEFPEVMLDGGFDAVVGNPPWNTLSPDVKEYFSTYDPTIFCRGVPKSQQDQRKEELRKDDEVDKGWRSEARFLHELSNYAKPDSNRFEWYAEDGQLRKGDANVFRLFVERGYRLLRRGGRLSQVLPDSLYVSSPATGVRLHLLEDGLLDRCWVFENRKGIFPIDSRIKIVLLVAEHGGGPTESFRAAFLTGKDAAGRERAVGLDELPSVLSDLDDQSPVLTIDQISALAPTTLAFPELQTALDAEIVAHCAKAVPPLNIDERGWGLTYCTELHADRDAHRFKSADYLEAIGAVRDGIRWQGPGNDEWWPLVEGRHFYHLEFPAESAEFGQWVRSSDLKGMSSRINQDGTYVGEHIRVARRNVGSPTNERSVVSALLPERTVAKHSAITVWGGSLSQSTSLALVALLSSITFDFLFRMSGKTNITNNSLDSVPSPSEEDLLEAVPIARRVIQNVGMSAEFLPLFGDGSDGPVLGTSAWQVGVLRAELDALVAKAYGLGVEHFAAVLSTFPNLDTAQPMLPGEPKCFLTRDLALHSYCQNDNLPFPDMAKLMREIGSGLPDPKPQFRDLDSRIEAYRELGAVPYRPTPRGARTPTDPSVIEDLIGAISDEPCTVAEIAEAMGEDESVVTAILKQLKRDGEVYSEGRGKGSRYYRLEDD